LDCLHVRLVASDPDPDLSLGQIAHPQGQRRLQEQAAVAFLDQPQRIAELIEAYLSPQDRRPCQTAALESASVVMR
jgi:hypothetical protein